ncbi:MAG: hypothetical protein PHQ65_04540 [Bacteroidales bacterium]|nr:hypothetical protein [Bacteroidales bacterium]MDD3664510.1 hypothetical protein [Bacteroidales bacterium]
MPNSATNPMHYDGREVPEPCSGPSKVASFDAPFEESCVELPNASPS